MSVVVKLVYKDDMAAPLEGVRARISDSADLFATELTSDSSGEAEVALDGAVSPGQLYFVRSFKQGVIFDDPTQQILVLEPLVSPATNVFDFVGRVPTLPESLDPDMCRITGSLHDVSGRPVKEVFIRVKPILNNPDAKVDGFPYPSAPTIVTRRVLMAEAKHTAVEGEFDFLLPRGGKFEAHVSGMETPDIIVEFINVPDAAAAQLEHILFPFVSSVTYDTDPVAVSAGSFVEIGVEALGIDGKVIDTVEDLVSLLDFTTADDSVATVKVTGVGVITVVGLAVGSTTLEVTRKDSTTAPQRPDLPDILVTPAVINVT